MDLKTEYEFILPRGYVDANGDEAGEWVNAWFLVDASATQPKREIVEYYFVKNGKIHEFQQSRRVIID